MVSCAALVDLEVEVEQRQVAVLLRPLSSSGDCGDLARMYADASLQVMMEQD